MISLNLGWFLISRPLDQGAYTCEAINVKGRVLATPDCIVRIVNIPAPETQTKAQCNAIGSVSPIPDHTGRCQCKVCFLSNYLFWTSIQ